MRTARNAAAVAAVLALAAGGCGSDSDAAGRNAPPPANFPALDVEPIMDGLDHPWDVVTAPDGTILTGERSGRFVALRPDGAVVTLAADQSDLFARGETGLMGIALATDFAQSRTVFTCQGHSGSNQDSGSTQDRGSTQDVRVHAWQVSEDWTALTRIRTVIEGLPSSTGRHGGCRILAHPDGTLYIGTGDAARPSNAQDRNSLGGKVLHIDTDGRPSSGTLSSDNPIFTLGHRNVQGLSIRPSTGEIYSVEQGSSRDDEVNRLIAGGNYGWRPDKNPGRYDESVPMTDPDRVPGALPAVWSSGPSTIATASGSFVTGEQWGAWNGSLAVGALKGRQLLLLQLSDDGSTTVSETVPPELDGSHGRIRTVAAQTDGSLLITTDNGSDDQVLRVSPRQ